VIGGTGCGEPGYRRPAWPSDHHRPARYERCRIRATRRVRPSGKGRREAVRRRFHIHATPGQGALAPEPGDGGAYPEYRIPGVAARSAGSSPDGRFGGPRYFHAGVEADPFPPRPEVRPPVPRCPQARAAGPHTGSGPFWKPAHIRSDGRHPGIARRFPRRVSAGNVSPTAGWGRLARFARERRFPAPSPSMWKRGFMNRVKPARPPILAEEPGRAWARRGQAINAPALSAHWTRKSRKSRIGAASAPTASVR